MNKEIEALEIIKKKKMLSIWHKNNENKYFIVFNNTPIEIPKEEFDLLKEVLL